MRRWLGIAAALAVAGCGDDGPAVADGGSDDGGPVDCSLPVHPDDLVLEVGQAAVLPGQGHRITALGSGFAACGDGFVAFWTPGSAPVTASDPQLAGVCGGIAALGEDRVVAVTHAGTVAVVGSDGAVVGATTRQDAIFRDVAVNGDEALVAAGPEGVIAYTVASGTPAERGVVAGSQDAHGVAMVGTAVLVADGFDPGTEQDPTLGGARIRLLDATAGGVRAELLGELGIATRAFVDGSRAVILRPGFGFDVLEVSETTVARTYATPVETGIPMDAAVVGDDLVIAAASAMHHFQLGPAEATLVGTETRAGRGQLIAPWLRSVAAGTGGTALATDDALVPVTVGDGSPSPDIDLEQNTFTMSTEQTESLIRFNNAGAAPLVLTGIEVDAPFSAEFFESMATPRDGCPGQFVVEPGDSVLAFLRHDGSAGHHEATLRVRTDDPDEPELIAVAERGRPLPELGSAVEDFVGLTVDGGQFRISQHLGKVVLAKLYNPF